MSAMESLFLVVGAASGPGAVPLSAVQLSAVGVEALSGPGYRNVLARRWPLKSSTMSPASDGHRRRG